MAISKIGVYLKLKKHSFLLVLSLLAPIFVLSYYKIDQYVILAIELTYLFILILIHRLAYVKRKVCWAYLLSRLKKELRAGKLNEEKILEIVSLFKLLLHSKKEGYMFAQYRKLENETEAALSDIFEDFEWCFEFGNNQHRREALRLLISFLEQFPACIDNRVENIYECREYILKNSKVFNKLIDKIKKDKGIKEKSTLPVLITKLKIFARSNSLRLFGCLLMGLGIIMWFYSPSNWQAPILNLLFGIVLISDPQKFDKLLDGICAAISKFVK